MPICKACGATFRWILTKNDKYMPVDADGKSHFATCPQAGQFRAAEPAPDPDATRQLTLLELPEAQ